MHRNCHSSANWKTNSFDEKRRQWEVCAFHKRHPFVPLICYLPICIWKIYWHEKMLLCNWHCVMEKWQTTWNRAKQFSLLEWRKKSGLERASGRTHCGARPPEIFQWIRLLFSLTPPPSPPPPVYVLLTIVIQTCLTSKKKNMTPYCLLSIQLVRAIKSYQCSWALTLAFCSSFFFFPRL